MFFQLHDTANLLSVLISLCFSFCILVLTRFFKKTEALPKLLGIAFVSAFLLSFAAIITRDRELSSVYSSTAAPLLILLITLLFVTKPGQKKFTIYYFVLTLLPLVLLITLTYFPRVRTFFLQPLTTFSAIMIASLIALYLLKNKKDETSLIFWSVLLLLAFAFAQYFLTFGMMVFVAPLFLLAFYITMLYFFYRIFFGFYLIKIEEADKKLSSINRSIEHEVKKRMLEIEKVNIGLVNISKIDAMSKVMNKSALLNSIESMINKKPESEFSILMFDIDNFKTINDTMGHVVGDKCIKELSTIGRNNIRDFDLIGRYGGDEFVIILPETGIAHAKLIAERFRQRIALTDSPHFTVSIGIASYPADGIDVNALIEAADEGLYTSKHKGRNAISHRTQIEKV